MAAFIEQLQAQLIQVQGAIFGGERFVKKDGQVIDNGINRTGFYVGQDGILKASGAEISGDIYANNGFFRGDLVSGAMISSNQDTDAMPPITFSANHTARDVYNHYGRSGTFPIESGSFGGQGGVIAITTRMDRVSVSGPGLGGSADRYNVDIQIVNQAPITRSWYDHANGRNTLGAALVLDGGRGGKTFILNGIPNHSNVGVGQLFTDDGNVLRIKR